MRPLTLISILLLSRFIQSTEYFQYSGPPSSSQIPKTIIPIPAHLTQISLPHNLRPLKTHKRQITNKIKNIKISNTIPKPATTKSIDGTSLSQPQMTHSSRDSHNRPKSDGPEMRIIVPLQGVVQGRGGLVLGSLLPCALFYFLQLYLKSRNRPSQSRPSSPLSSPDDHGNHSPSSPPSAASGSSIQRTLSRGLLSPRFHPFISSRAAAVARPEEDSLYYVGYRRCLEDAYHPLDNPEGVVQLGLAETRLSQDLVMDWLEKKAHGALLGGERPDELSIMGLTTYQPFDGSDNLKIAVAGFMGQVMQGSVCFDPSQIVLTCGATPAMEILSFCIADPGNAFLVPSPYYPGWDRDIKWRTGIELVPVPCRSTDNFSISIAALERAYSQAKKRGLKIRAVLIANPTNPTGHVLSREILIDLLDFVAEKNIHLISDEVFAGSIHGDQSKFVSVAEVLESEEIDKSRVHIIYGMSKDLSLPGCRVGVIHSYNETVIAASAKLARFSSISAPTQELLISMLSDMQFISDYLEMNRQRLRKMHSLFVDALKQLGIECANSNAGFYCWADMSRYIKSYSEKGEIKLWEKLLTVGKVNVTPGLSCHCIEPGWFRCCFTTLTEEDIPLVVERIKRVIQGVK